MKNFLKFAKYFFIILISIVLVTIGINAADKRDNFSESIIGRVIFGEESRPCPDGMVFVASSEGGFCIDKYEASPGGNCPELIPDNQASTRINLADPSCTAVSKAETTPWRFISQTQAAEACAKAGKRLPTNKEWLQASLGTPDLPSGWGSDDCQVGKNWLTQPGKTGQGVNCVSAAGVYDMIGNVWEWVDGTINDGFYEGQELPGQGYVVSANTEGLASETSNTEDPNYYNDYFWIKNSGVRGMARGGYWDNQAGAGQYAMYLVSPPSFAGTGVGFRCAK